MSQNIPIPDEVRQLVIAAREMWDLYGDSGDDLDRALERFSEAVPYEDQPDPVGELVDMLSIGAGSDGITVFDHTPEEIGLHVMENHQAVLAALREKANG